MIIAIIVVIIIITLLLLIMVMSLKNQVVWLKKCFLRLCLKVLKLSVFFNVSGILFLNEGPIKDKALWPVFVFWKGRLSFMKLLL